MFYTRNQVDKWDIRLSKLNNDAVVFSIYSCAILFGFLFSSFGKMIGMSVDMEGVEYYREAHLTSWNSTYSYHMYALYNIWYFISISISFGLNNYQHVYLLKLLFLIYSTHYLTVNPVIGLFFIIIYISTPLALLVEIINILNIIF